MTPKIATLKRIHKCAAHLKCFTAWKLHCEMYQFFLRRGQILQNTRRNNQSFYRKWVIWTVFLNNPISLAEQYPQHSIIIVY